MSLINTVANWICGGAIRDQDIPRTTFGGENARLAHDRAVLEAQAREQAHRADLLQERLNRIAACETPGANATVRRMAKIAREALE